MNLKTFLLTKSLNAVSAVILLCTGLFFVYQSLSSISANGSLQRGTGFNFFKGIYLLAMFALPLFCFIFLKKKHSVYNIFVLTLINVGLALFVLLKIFID